jgi:lysophospholipase L1-like esterase
MGIRNGESGIVRTTATYFINTVILLIVLNVILGIYYHFYDAHIARDPNRIFRGFPNAVVLKNIQTLYPTMTQAEVAQLFREEYRPWQADWFTGFSEAPFQGKYVNVSPNGFRVGTNQGPWPPDHKKSYVVYLFGGSTAFSYGETDAQAFGSVLQPLLEKKLGRPVSVYNFGQSSWFSTQERILLEQLILSGQKPDLAVFLDGLNDFHWINQVMPAIPIDRPSFPKPPTFRSVLKDAKTVLPMTRLAISVHNALEKSAHRKTSDELKVANTKFDDPVSLQNAVDRYFTNKRMIEAEAKEYGVKTLFVWEPAPFYKYDEKIDPFIDPEYGFSFTGFTYVKYGYPVMRDYVDRTHPDNFLWCADLQQDLHELLYVDPYHYSPKMTEIISGCIVDGVK